MKNTLSIPLLLCLLLPTIATPLLAVEKKAGKAPLVSVAAVVLDSGGEVLERSATLRPVQLVKVLNEEPGRLSEIHRYEGERVKAGDVLARQDDGLVRAQWLKARAQREQAVEEWKRQQVLKQEGMISAETYSQARTQVKVMIAEERLLAERLNYMTLRSPIDGVVSARLVEQGDVVERYQHLFTVIDDHILQLRVALPEDALQRLQQDAPVSVRVDAVSGEAYAARISRIFPALDEATHQATIELQLLPGFYGIRSGQLARVSLPLRPSPYPLVPLVALRQDEQGAYVWRLREGERVERAAVSSGHYQGDWVEVRQGLQTGDRVVVRGFSGLKPGQQVTVVGLDGKP